MKRSINAAREQGERWSGRREPSLRQAVRLNSVNLAFDDHQVLSSACIQVPLGSITTLVGPSGAGKSSVVNCITGLLVPDSGSVEIDGVPLSDMDLAAWRSRIGYVPQEHLILNDSVRNNVTLGDDAVPDAAVERALASAGILELVRTMPDGLDTAVGERGGRLSGGQRQRLMLARALLHHPWLLILDEATSGLDPEAEADIGRTLERLKSEMAILAVFHQSELASFADYAYRLEGGRLEPLE